ncbi:hypothetical protein BpHYR1_051547 [Brachionus plicatilis]|uniref:Uncharacterized protein n=1 Tax=Brachionus plicatilis TaxID=10195 RepID=A0A3M7Q2A3_BRAPC|nr:hypothetical protein BpHYR1_051547 [Brachionus plicatilis]
MDYYPNILIYAPFFDYIFQIKIVPKFTLPSLYRNKKSYSSYDVSGKQLLEDFGCTQILNKEKKFESIIVFFG